MGNRDHVGVAVNVLVENLRIPGVRTEAHRAVVKAQVRHSWRGNRHVSGDIQRVACTKLVQHRRAKGVDVTDLSVRKLRYRRIQKSGPATVAVAYRVREPELIR